MIATMVGRAGATGRVHQVATVNVDFVVNAADRRRAAGDHARRPTCRSPTAWASCGAPASCGTPDPGAHRRRRPRAGTRPTGGARRLAAVPASAAAPASPSAPPACCAAGAGRRRVGRRGAARSAPTARWTSAVVDELRAVDADVIGVALGNPKQERWIARHGQADRRRPVLHRHRRHARLPHRGHAPGTGVDAGAGLEWIHRGGARAAPPGRPLRPRLRVLRTGLARQVWLGRRRGEAIVPTVAVGSGVRIVVDGALPDATTEQTVTAELRAGGTVTIDVTALVHRADNVTLSALAGLQREGRRWGADISVVGPAEVVDLVGRIGGNLAGQPGHRGVPPRGGE